jgi:hypothetical protein
MAYHNRHLHLCFPVIIPNFNACITAVWLDMIRLSIKCLIQISASLSIVQSRDAPHVFLGLLFNSSKLYFSQSALGIYSFINERKGGRFIFYHFLDLRHDSSVSCLNHSASILPGKVSWHFLNFLPLPQKQGSLRSSFKAGRSSPSK